MLYILSSILQEIEQAIAIHPAERGGALLGPVSKPIITHFIFDNMAQTTGSTYHPSQELTQRVQEVELRQGLEFKGVIHSHPGGFDRLSGFDEDAVLEGLNLNPHLPCFFAPIISNKGLLQGLGDHELPLDNGKKISCYAAYRQNRGIRVETIAVQQISEPELIQIQPTMQSPAVQTIPLLADLQQLCDFFGSNTPPETFVTEFEEKTIPAGQVIIGDLELLFLASASYPVHKPILLITPAGGDTEEVEIPWLSATPPAERLLTAVKTIITGNAPYHKVYGTVGKPALTSNPETAQLAGWQSSYSGVDPNAAATEIQQELFARSTGVLSQHISSKGVLVAGTGSVGSYIAEQLVRSGVGKLTLIDPETVEAANLCRTTYDINDLGRTKVEALAKRLLHINPKLELTLYPQNLSDFTPAEFAALVAQADLVIATTDDVNAQRILNRFAYNLGKPALFIGLYKGAEGGEVIFTIPNRTPCYMCVTANRHQFEQVGNSVTAEGDYGSNGRVMGEVAISADIHHVSSVAVKMALSLLLPEDAEAKLKGFLNPAIDEKLNYLTMSMVDNYWFYPSIFGDTPGQYAYQSVWLTASNQDECPVCGSVHHRVDPLAVPLRTLQAEGIRAALSHSRSSV
jgi:molybdopterin/thiamine biosynthesis adenylyltransferase/proteasome lid subunit RPN8/RPN11